MRTTSLAAGVLYLITFVSIPTLVLYNPAREAGFILGTGSATSVVIGAILEVIVALASIGTAVVLFPVIKRQNEAAAMGLVGSRVLEGATIFVGVACMLTIVTLRRDGAEADSVATANALIGTYDGTFLIGQSIMPAINALLLGTLLYKSRLVPRMLPVVGLIGAPLLLLAQTGVLFDLWGRTSAPTGILTIPIGLWEFSLGVYLVVKGFRPSAVTELAAHPDPLWIAHDPTPRI
jgi:hypothetical protein